MDEDNRTNPEQLSEDIEDGLDLREETGADEQPVDAEYEQPEEGDQDWEEDGADDDWEDDEFVPNFVDPVTAAKKRDDNKRRVVAIRLKDGTVVNRDELPPLEDLTDEQRAKRKKFRKRLLLFFLILTIVEMAWLGIRLNYHADETALAAAEYAEVVNKGLVFRPEGEVVAGVILYPGAQVEHIAYAALAKELCDEGCLVVIPKMTLNMAIISPLNGEVFLNTYKDETDNWYIGGHSIGGVAAAQFTTKYASRVNGLILLASYSQSNISEMGLPVLAIYASEDMILDETRREKYVGLLPADTVTVEIEGGNHSGFGSFGQQEGDGQAKISQTEQRARTVEAIMDFVAK